MGQQAEYGEPAVASHRPEPKPWDFTQILELVNSLTTPPPSKLHERYPKRNPRPSKSPEANPDSFPWDPRCRTRLRPTGSENEPVEQPRDGHRTENGGTLGNFDPVLNFVRQDDAHMANGYAQQETAHRPEMYMSDGALYGATPSRNRNVRLGNNAISGGNLTDVQQGGRVSNDPRLQHLSLRVQQKIENGKQRARQKRQDRKAANKKRASASETDAERLQQPTRSAMEHQIAVHGTQKIHYKPAAGIQGVAQFLPNPNKVPVNQERYELRSQARASLGGVALVGATSLAFTDVQDLSQAVSSTAGSGVTNSFSAAQTDASSPDIDNTNRQITANETRFAAPPLQEHVEPVDTSVAESYVFPGPSSGSHIVFGQPSTPQPTKNPWQATSTGHSTSQILSNTLRVQYSPQIPAHVAQSTIARALRQPGWLQPGFLGGTVQPHTMATASPYHNRPLQVRDGVERNIALRLRLVHDFIADKVWLASPVPLADHTNPHNGGLHVFVDFSNIWVGFKQQVHRLRKGHPDGHRIPHDCISFDSLVLLLERGRPVAKRVLAGSLPLMPAFERARAIGYEVNILNKVFKAREPSDTRHRRSFNASSGEKGGVSGVLSTNNAFPQPPTGPEKWVEQGVDEVLHLKILESVVDAEGQEISTIVLATGDAAKAEYSEGFRKMADRALTRGWRVEVVGWRDSISGEYKKPSWKAKHKDRFRIIELDDYVEYLLDT